MFFRAMGGFANKGDTHEVWLLLYFRKPLFNKDLSYKQKIYINKEKEYWVSKNDRKKLVIEQIKNRGRKDKKNTD